ncbi:hypothetical protein IHE55_11625 [Streptomyces pactum]|uniref:Uncharacterized protein n=2 Tax=Streptomyces pactum TaxID=68249 RepID=A0ABS0NJN3_9ACTN|nr:hypothetical protein [Streptomyces pactum]
MDDAAIRWGVASALGGALAALAVAWGYGFATRTPQNPGPTPADGSAHASGPRSVAIGGSNSGTISTGDNAPRTPPAGPPAQPPAAPPAPAPAPPPSTVSASGERSVAIGGDNSGTVSTGDQSEGQGR